MSTLAFLSAHATQILGAILATKLTATFIVNLTPTPNDDTAVAAFYRGIEVLAGIWTKQAKE